MKKLLVIIIAMFVAANAHADQSQWEAAIKAGNPLHWYKFNETAGTDCLDSGSAVLNGLYSGVSLNQQGYFGAGTAARFTRSNDNMVNFTGATDLSGLWTAEYIVKTVKPPAGQQAQALHDSATSSVRLAGWNSPGEAGFTLYGVADYQFTPATGLTLTVLIVQQDEWMHLVWRRDSSGTQLFFNGKLVGTNANGISLGRMRIGSHVGTANALDGVLDEAVVFSRALTNAEIIAHAKAAYLVDESIFRAGNPKPANGAVGVTSLLFEWTPGVTAAQHEIYLGTNPTPGPAEFRGRQQFNMYWHAAGLAPQTTYYWRVDEIEADGTTIHTGDVWSFTAAPSTAYNPYPPDGAKWVDTDAKLSWSAGLNGVTHDVYFGTDETAVAQGTADTFKINQAAITYDPGTLAKDTTYYWRVDEVETDRTTKHIGKVWSFKTLSDIPVTDPDLLGWWRLDRGYGISALDWSGHGHNGTLVNGPQWVDGYDGSALKFDGINDYVNLGTPSELYLPQNYTYTAWFKVGKDINGDSGPQYLLCIGSRSDLVFGVEDGVGTNGDLSLHYYDTAPGFHAVSVGQTVWSSDQWHMVAGTKDSATGHKIYLDGQLKNSDTNTNNDNYATTRMISIGARAWTGHQFFNGTIDDVRIYSRALTQEEIKQVMRIDPLLAWDASPVNGSTPDIDRAIPLSWKAGDEAAQHDVYLSADKDAVENATTASIGIYRGRQVATSYTPGEALVWGQTYYWRIDEYNADGTISTGRIWNFTVADYLIVDDFEDYTDEVGSRIFQTWKDGYGYTTPPPGYPGNGTGSAVGNSVPPYTEQTIFHGGGQSLSMAYDNTGLTGKARYSETFRELTSPPDWTRYNIKALKLYFHCDLTNAAEQLYVALEDNTGKIKVVNHPEIEAVQKAAWQEWNIELSQFSAAGVNLKVIKKMYIGLGNRTSPAAGGTGIIYIDDIRLYSARCVPATVKPAADLSGNCVVDQADVDILAGLWLNTGLQITPVDPGTTGLIARYPFDGNVNDVVGGHNGTTVGMPSYAAGKIGQAILLDGVDDVVNVGAVGISGAAARTIAGWAKANATTAIPDWTTVFGFSNDLTANQAGTYFDIQRRGSQLQYCIHVYGWEQNLVGIDLDWHHLAATYDGTTIAWYADGRLVNSQAYTINTLDNVMMGKRGDRDSYFPGRVDEVHIYNRALSAAQIASLAGYTSALSVPADLHQDGVIDFKDFAVLADAWLEELLWP
jgi:hypothetical protein